MAYAISIRSDDRSSIGIRALWKTCSQLELSPSMEALNYAPHITFAVYDDISIGRLSDAVDSAFDGVDPMTVRFGKLDYFETPRAIILWAAPMLPSGAWTIHERIHSKIEADICRLHYRPGSWVPHCSVALTVAVDRKEEVLALVEQSIKPVDVIFDVADCVSFLPVQVLHEKALRVVPTV
jgi:2'-5' RNA ligase